MTQKLDHLNPLPTNAAAGLAPADFVEIINGLVLVINRHSDVINALVAIVETDAP